ncbi:signal peptidase II [Fructilactobacillus fructivorans]|uniref:Lipoprotein signal peptidase n=2 Tax=Fructilactobacillus fructivorans TaxID=1614 RepID=A0A0C1PPG7_9LACO|nr:Lipoprotein signal peptidase [Fructilactobacillus fructivorans]
MKKSPAYSKNRILIWILTALLFVLLLTLDQVSKSWIRLNIPTGRDISVIPGILSLTNINNTGAAWSFLSGKSFIFEIIAVIAVFVFLFFIYFERNHTGYLIGLTLMLAGTIGNLLDRFLVGSVTDMIQLDFINFPIFNVADSCVTIGVIVLFLVILLAKPESEKHAE